MPHLISVISVLGVLGVVGVAGLQTAPPQIRHIRTVQLDTAPDQLMDAEVGRQGQFCLVDGGKGEVRCYTIDGKTKWRAGRKGEGPGEYRAVYRLAISPTGTVFAFDIAKMTVTQYDNAGRLIRSGLVPFAMRQVGDLVAPDDSTLAIAGYASRAGSASRHGVHIFRWDSTITLLRSAGRLPGTLKPEVLNYWGTGNIRLGDDGAITYQVSAPHEMETFGTSGAARRTLQVSVEVSGPDDTFAIEESATQFAIRRIQGTKVVLPMGIESISPSLWVMQRRIRPDSSYRGPLEVLDLIGPDGQSRASWAVPDSISPMGLIDGPSSARGIYGVSAANDDVTIVVFDVRF